MSKKRKRLERLMNGSLRTDVTFDEIDTILRSEGFNVTNVEGSHNKYEHPIYKDIWIIIVRPHGGKTNLHRNKIKRIREMLNDLKDREGDKNE